jgi:hypothetical protein
MLAIDLQDLRRRLPHPRRHPVLPHPRMLHKMIINRHDLVLIPQRHRLVSRLRV